MMDSGPVRNMSSILSNKFEKLCISLAFIIKIYHNARSYECTVTYMFYWLLNTARMSHVQLLGVKYWAWILVYRRRSPQNWGCWSQKCV